MRKHEFFCSDLFYPFIKKKTKTKKYQNLIKNGKIWFGKKYDN